MLSAHKSGYFDAQIGFSGHKFMYFLHIFFLKWDLSCKLLDLCRTTLSVDYTLYVVSPSVPDCGKYITATCLREVPKLRHARSERTYPDGHSRFLASMPPWFFGRPLSRPGLPSRLRARLSLRTVIEFGDSANPSIPSESRQLWSRLSV